MPQMFIPSIGTQIVLTRGWEFPLYEERRNDDFIQRVAPSTQRLGRNGSVICSLEKGTILKVDRIYIRQKAGEYDSISFRIVEAPKDSKRESYSRKKCRGRWDREEPKEIAKKPMQFAGGRFWAKLDDVNEIHYKAHTENA